MESVFNDKMNWGYVVCIFIVASSEVGIRTIVESVFYYCMQKHFFSGDLVFNNARHLIKKNLSA